MPSILIIQRDLHGMDFTIRKLLTLIWQQSIIVISNVKFFLTTTSKQNQWGGASMKPYDSLTPAGIKRRLRKVAELALEEYALAIESIDYLIEETNVFFKLMDTDGNKYALKVFQEESSTIEDNLAEVFFIDTVKKNSDIEIPEVVPASDGRGVVVIKSPYTPTAKRVAVYKWLEGEDLDGKESTDRFFELGAMTAKLHLATAQVSIPENLSPKRRDKVFYYNDEVAVYKEESYQEHLSKQYHKLMDSIIPYLNEKLLSYYDNANPQLIHADLNPWNVKVHGDELRLLDFEEAMLGIPVHDFAIMLFYYRHDDNFVYEDVKKAFFDGYASLQPLPEFSEFDLELLMTARRVNFLNYILQISPDPKTYIEKNLPRVEAFLEEFSITL